MLTAIMTALNVNNFLYKIRVIDCHTEAVVPVQFDTSAGDVAALPPDGPSSSTSMHGQRRVQRANLSDQQIPSMSSFLFAGRLGMRFERGSVVGGCSRECETMMVPLR